MSARDHYRRVRDELSGLSKDRDERYEEEYEEEEGVSEC